MKKLLFLIIMFIVSPVLSQQTSWKPVSQEQREYEFLMRECSRIIAAMGGDLKSSRVAGAIFKYLKDVGTPTSLRVLKEQIKLGRVPARYLKLI